MSANPNNTAEQKAQWESSKKLGSRFIKFHSSVTIAISDKAPSRRDRWRMEVAARKAA